MFKLFTPILLSIFGLWVALYSYFKYGDFKSYGAAFYPTVIGFLVFLFAILDFLMEIKIKAKAERLSFNLKQDGKFILLIIAIVSFYIFTSNYLGFIITTTIILNSLILPLIKEKRIFIALFLLLLSVAIYLLFAKVLVVALPSGVFFG